MTEDRKESDLLAALRDVARDEDLAADALWDAVQAGSAEALPEDGPDLEALAPLDEAERADLVDGLFGLAETPTEAPAAPVLDLAAHRRRRFMTAGVGLALAAGLAMVVFGRAASLPDYALEVRAGEQTLRGDEVASTVYTEGSVLSAVLRPDVGVEGGVDVAVVLVPEAGRAQRVELRTKLSETGAVRLTGVVGKELPVGPGQHTLVFLVAPKGDLPSDPAAAYDAAPAGGQRLQYVFRVSKRE